MLGDDETLCWRDVGTIEAYFDAHMDLCSVKPQFANNRPLVGVALTVYLLRMAGRKER